MMADWRSSGALVPLRVGNTSGTVAFVRFQSLSGGLPDWRLEWALDSWVSGERDRAGTEATATRWWESVEQA